MTTQDFKDLPLGYHKLTDGNYNYDLEKKTNEGKVCYILEVEDRPQSGFIHIQEDENELCGCMILGSIVLHQKIEFNKFKLL